MRHQPLQPISPSIEAETGLAGGSDESGMVIGGTSAEDEGGEVDGGDDGDEVQPPPPPHEIPRRKGFVPRAGAEIVEEAEVPKMARDPGQPSQLDRQLHKLTHCPYRSWCEHCVRGQAVGRQHRAVPIEKSASEVPRVIIDYAFLQEDMTKEIEDDNNDDEVSSKEGVRATMKVLVMVETLCGSIWTYVVESKGTLMEP